MRKYVDDVAGGRFTLTGVRLSPIEPGESSRRLAAEGRVTYWPEASTRRVEMRGSIRRRVRLRSAKLLDDNSRFLCDCRILDRSGTGLRLALARESYLSGKRFWLHDDETGTLSCVSVVWRKGLLIGVRLGVPPSKMPKASLMFALRHGYYAIPDD